MAAERPTKASRHRVICADRQVPPGGVVIELGFNQACPGEGDNSMVIKRPGRREVICEASPVPDGYERVRRTRSESCPGEGENGWLIERREP